MVFDVYMIPSEKFGSIGSRLVGIAILDYKSTNGGI